MQPTNKLPLGLQDFSSVIENNLIYIDKTNIILEILNDSKYLFFSRPRRFGKSLVCSALKYLYQGRKDLFAGLYIEDKIDWSKFNFSVLHIDFSQGQMSSNLNESLYLRLENFCNLNNIKTYPNNAVETFEKIFTHYSALQKKVVVIIDEYDVPLNDNLFNNAKFDENRDILRDFYKTLKANDVNIEKVFITGVSKYGKVSLFSGPNNISDISFKEEYTQLCGITQTELEHYFPTYIQKLANTYNDSYERTLALIKLHYNGFSFDGINTLYNPFSLLSVFNDKKYLNYWFNSGSSKLLVQIMYEKEIQYTDLEGKIVDESFLEIADNIQQNLASLMFQTGYLTLKNKQLDEDNKFNYTLGFPNIEVKESFAKYVLTDYLNKGNNYFHSENIIELRNFLHKKQINEFIKLIKDNIFAKIPHSLFNQNERYYHSIFLTCLNSLGFETSSQVPNNIGVLDTIVFTPNIIYIFECKIKGTPASAIKQIHEKNYALPYLNSGKEIILVGIKFNTTKKNIDGVKWEGV